MTLHPDILTDLVILYHAGEASLASRSLLEEEAARNPQIAAALAATPGTIPPLPVCSAPEERKVLRKVRLRYQAITFAIVWMLILLSVALLPRFVSTGAGLQIAIRCDAVCGSELVISLALAGALYFLTRAIRSCHAVRTRRADLRSSSCRDRRDAGEVERD